MVLADRARQYMKEVGWPVGIWLLLLLLRPVIDTTWDWKHGALGFSPLQLVGAGLPAFFVWALWLRRGELRGLLRGQWEMLAWGVLLLVASVAAVIVQPDAEAAGAALKFVLPPLAVGFGYVYLRDERVLRLAAVALALAGIVPLLFVLYELIVGPMATSIRGGVPRFTGPYAQSSVYGMHFSLMLLGLGWLVLRGGGVWLWALLAAVAVMGFAAAFIVHVSSWVVLLALVMLILAVLIWRSRWQHAALLGAVVVLSTVTGFTLRPEHTYHWVLMRDVEIIEGKFPAEQFANSRGAIWARNMDDFSRLPWCARLFGSSLSGRNYFGATAFGAHNDFLRVLVLTGVVGLLLYLFWLIRVGVVVGKGRGERRLLGAGAMIVLLGYSVALTPTYIVPLVTAVLPLLGALRYARPADAGRATQGDRR